MYIHERKDWPRFTGTASSSPNLLPPSATGRAG